MSARISPDRWPVVIPYLDRALDLRAEERGPWLALLRAEDPALADDLLTLLQRHDSLEEQGFLEGAPTPTPGAPAPRLPAAPGWLIPGSLAPGPGAPTPTPGSAAAAGPAIIMIMTAPIAIAPRRNSFFIVFSRLMLRRLEGGYCATYTRLLPWKAER